MSLTSYKHRLIKNILALDAGKSQTRVLRGFFHLVIIFYKIIRFNHLDTRMEPEFCYGCLKSRKLQ